MATRKQRSGFRESALAVDRDVCGRWMVVEDPEAIWRRRSPRRSVWLIRSDDAGRAWRERLPLIDRR